MKKSLVLLAFLTAALPGISRAASITVDADFLRDSVGNAFPLTGLVVLTSSTDGLFSGPSTSLFGGGSEIVIKIWDLSSWATPGVFMDTTGDFSYNDLSPNLDVGDFLKLYWYPTLTLASTAPGANTPYGEYRDPATTTSALLDGGSDLWELPAENGAIALKFATTDQSFLFSSNGSNTPASAQASLTTVPEPSIYLGSGLLAVIGLAYRRLRKS